MKFITIREIADNETTISSTRWGWAYALKIDAIVIVAFPGLTSSIFPVSSSEIISGADDS